MASPSDYRKPRNKELQDLTWNLPYPLRIKDEKGQVLWQNRAAEPLPEDLDWSEHSLTWQNKKAFLHLPERSDGKEMASRLGELEDKVEQAKKTQRQTARKKRQAEASLAKLEKTLEETRKQEVKLQERLQQVERENRQLQRKLDSEVETKRESVKVIETKPPEEGSGSEVARLREDKQALETWVEELEQKTAQRDLEVEQQRKAFARLETEFRDYKQRVEEEDAQRKLEEQLAEKISEFELLEKSLEEEQKSFELEKQELQEKLKLQEDEFLQLKTGFESRSREQEAVPLVEIESLQEELQEAKDDLELAGRKEKRLHEKIHTLEELRAEHFKVFEMLKEELTESKAREKELKSSLQLYGDLRSDLEAALTETKALQSTVADLQANEHKLRRELVVAQGQSGKASPTVTAAVSEDQMSVPVKNHIDLLKKRLTDTEKKLDELKLELNTEKAKNQTSKESERLAFQDSLTGLPNRNMIDRYLQYAHHQALTTGRSIGLFLIDIDGFRVLNGAYGREWGDTLLKAVGERLNGMRGSTHLFARHSQDRFLLLAADIDKAGAKSFVEQASKSLLDALAYPFEVEGDEVRLTGSIGASLGPLSGDHSKELYYLAQTALDASKERGPGNFLLFNEHLNQNLQRDQLYIKQMGHAAEKDEFLAVFQPVYNLQKGRVLGLELLARWQHRDQKLLKPSDFLEPAIKSGMIFKITEKLWPKAFRNLARWQRLRPGLTLSINLCDKELLSPALLKRAIEWVDQAGLDRGSVFFEVRDQSQLRLSTSWWRVLQDYAQAGFGLCLDDFGSDSSIFGTLAFHGFKQAKILVDEKRPVFSPALQANSGVRYGAKGLQTKFDKKTLAKAGFDWAQGYAVSKPIEASEVDGLLS